MAAEGYLERCTISLQIHNYSESRCSITVTSKAWGGGLRMKASKMKLNGPVSCRLLLQLPVHYARASAKKKRRKKKGKEKKKNIRFLVELKSGSDVGW